MSLSDIQRGTFLLLPCWGLCGRAAIYFLPEGGLRDIGWMCAPCRIKAGVTAGERLPRPTPLQLEESSYASRN